MSEDGLVQALLDSAWNPLDETFVLGSDVPAFGERSAEVLEDLDEIVRIRTSGEGLLVLADTYSPGWHAIVDGTAQPLRIAEGQFRAVAVPAGTHEVTFEFRTPGLTIGISITIATLLALIALLVRSWRPPLPGDLSRPDDHDQAEKKTEHAAHDAAPRPGG